MSALYSLVIYLVCNGYETMDEGCLLKFKLIYAMFVDWEMTLQSCLYTYL